MAGIEFAAGLRPCAFCSCNSVVCVNAMLYMQDEDQEEINRYPDKKKYDYQGTRDTSLYDISIIS